MKNNKKKTLLRSIRMKAVQEFSNNYGSNITQINNDINDDNSCRKNCDTIRCGNRISLSCRLEVEDCKRRCSVIICNDNGACINKWCQDTNGGKKCTFGSTRGANFVGLGKINKLQLFGEEFVDAISINDTKFGAEGSSSSTAITLDDDEYISQVIVVQKSIGLGLIGLGLIFITSKGQNIRGGNANPTPSLISFIQLTNIKVTEIGGSVGDSLNGITINYINN